MTDSQRHLFSIPDDVHYINCAYMSPLLKSVEAAGIEGVRAKASPWKLTGDDFFDPPEVTRRLMGQLINTSEEAIALTPAVSYGAAIAAQAVDLRKDQNVVVPAEEFPSVVYSWREKCKVSGAELRTVDRPDVQKSQGPEWNARILDAIDSQTAVVALTMNHWTDGTLFDLQAIGDRAREVGAVYILDGTQTVGAMPFDFDAIAPDFLLCAGYKWLMGPYTLGITAIGERFREALPIEHSWIAREKSEDFANLINYRDGYQPGSRRFDMGERSNFALVPMLNAALEQILAWTPDAIQAHCTELGQYLEKLLGESSYRISPSTERAAHLFGVRTSDPSLIPRISETLQKNNVHVSLRGDAIRLSPHLYNTKADIEVLAETLLSVID